MFHPSQHRTRTIGGAAFEAPCRAPVATLTTRSLEWNMQSYLLDLVIIVAVLEVSKLYKTSMKLRN